MSLYAVARKINESLAAKSSMAIGKRLMHPDGYLVEVTSGCYLDPVYHRVTNFWYWKRVNADDSLSTEEECGYGW
jgi:hypothetical protein